MKSDVLDLLPSYDFDFSKPVVGFGNFTKKFVNCRVCNIDRSFVDKKLRIFSELASSDNEFDNAKAFLLNKDKSIFCYNNFLFNNNPMKLRWYQDVLLSDTYDRILFVAANQIGKSITLCVDAASEFLQDHNKEWVGILVSNSLDQSTFQMDRIKQFLKSANISYREEDTFDTKTGKKDNSTKISYTFYSEDGKTPLYTNLLICCPHTSSALGYPADVLWLDEFDFWENCDQEHFMFQIAIPRTFDTKGKIKIFTNPNGKERMTWKLWNMKDSKDNFVWHRYQFNYWDKPGASQIDFDKNSVGMSQFQVESTLLAVFGKSEGAFFSSKEIHDMFDKELSEKGDMSGFGRDTAWFLDVGSVHDQSVLVGGYLEENPEVPEIPLIKIFWIHKYPVGYPLARVFGVDSSIDEFDGWEEYSEDNPSVKEVLEKYSFGGEQPLFGFDATGNSGLIPLCVAAGIDAVDIIFSGKKKWDMYLRFQYYVQKRFIKRCKERDSNTVRGCDFDYQMSKLVVKKTQNMSYRKIHHESESDLDDCMDAVVGLIHLIENPDLPSLSFDIINDGRSVLEDVEKEYKEKVESGDVYVPSFYDRSELDSWIDQKERSYQ